MTRPYAPGHRIPTDLLLKAYASGVFPMAESAADPEVFWVRPETRGIIPLDAFHIPRSLAKAIRQGRFTVIGALPPHAASIVRGPEPASTTSATGEPG